MPAQVVPSLTRWFTPAALALDGWGVRYARERVLRGNATDWAAAWRAFKGLDVQGRLEEFEPPALVLAGELDASTTPEIMGGIHERIPRLDVHPIAGHAAHADARAARAGREGARRVPALSAGSPPALTRAPRAPPRPCGGRSRSARP